MQESKPGFKESYRRSRDKVWSKKSERVRLHESFRRSYREDYVRPLSAPGLLHHAMSTLRFVLKKWRLFVPLLLVIVGLNIVLVGLMSESTYVTFQDTLEETNEYLVNGRLGQVAKASLLLISTVTTGGLNGGMTEVQQIFAILLFIIVWLVTIYLIRHILAGNKPKLRDGLYNALSPLISTLMVLLVVFLHLIPIFIVLITYSAAVATDFLSTPLYAFIYWLLAAGLILLSCYLLPGSLLGLVAISAPGMYPMAAINTASDLIQGRRTKFVIRLIFGIFFLAVLWVVVMLPLILLDLVLKGAFGWMAGVPVVPFLLLAMTIFTFIYVSAYVYLYYRRMLDDPN
ncbi:MAG: hypothetical protein LBT19_01705 [Candidatus Nomurabacteria bacterium]|jgi:hypothetical protein|nr:hypothetical protein [Candidatus Nomurabacteria bacterium]